jgi:hypothetical protein
MRRGKSHAGHKKPTYKSIRYRDVSRRATATAKVANQNAKRVLPVTRGECPSVRPCGFVSCVHNLAIEASPKTGTIKLTYGSEDVADWPAGNCALDWADRNGMDHVEIGKAMALTRSRVQQLEERALRKLANNARVRRMLGGGG